MFKAFLDLINIFKAITSKFYFKGSKGKKKSFLPNTRKELFNLRSQIDTILQGRSKDKSLISNLSKKLEMMEQNFHPMKIQIDLLEKKLKELEKKNS